MRSVAARAAMRLRDLGPATLSELSRELDLSRTSVENALPQLSRSGLVALAPATQGTGAGRPAKRYRFVASEGVVVGVDVGLASVRVVVADLAGTVAASRQFAGIEEAGSGADKLVATIECIRATLSEAGILQARVRSIGTALPGIVNDRGQVVRSIVIPEWTGADIAARMRETFACPVTVDNGVRLAAVAEHHLGVAQLIDDILYVSVGNRIATSLILNGVPRRGAHHIAGDVGRVAFRGLKAHTGRIVWESAPTAREVFDRADAGDKAAVDEIARFVDEVAHGIAVLSMAIDPAMIVVGGGLSGAHERFLGPLRRAIPAQVGYPIDLPVVEARLGADAPAHGALVHAFRTHADDVFGIVGMSVPPIIPSSAGQ
ncbi:ROK family transcriptional regulator [Microbacterium sp. JB110]|nr:ROK family transcriptional regulator [Microbacterium sp. JB110]